MTSPCSASSIRFSTPFAPHFIADPLADKIAHFLIDAREKTVSDSETLLMGLEGMRNNWAECHQGIEIALRSESGELVNGMHFKGAQNSAILFLHGNGCFYETSLHRPLSFVQDLNKSGISPHLLCFNPRGTGKSEGIPHPANVAEDMRLAFEYLVDKQKIDPNHIIIIGHSMGGFFGAFGAQVIQERFPANTIHFISDRSFRHISDRITRKLQSTEQSSAGSNLTRITMERLSTFWGWNNSPLAALESLKGRVCVLYHEQDPVIPYETSLHAYMKAQESLSKSYFCLQLGEIEIPEMGAQSHNRGFTDAEYTKLLPEIKKMLLS